MSNLIDSINESFFGQTKTDQKVLLKEISTNDQKLGIRLIENLDYLNNISCLTTRMKIDLLKSIELEDLAVALKITTKDVIINFAKDLTRNLLKDFLYYLNKPQKVSAVIKAQDKVSRVMRHLENRGLIHLDPEYFKLVV